MLCFTTQIDPSYFFILSMSVFLRSLFYHLLMYVSFTLSMYFSPASYCIHPYTLICQCNDQQHRYSLSDVSASIQHRVAQETHFESSTHFIQQASTVSRVQAVTESKSFTSSKISMKNNQPLHSHRRYRENCPSQTDKNL